MAAGGAPLRRRDGQSQRCNPQANALLGLALVAGDERFRQALAVAPDNLITTFNMALALLELDPGKHRDEANLLLRVIEAQPYVELAAKAQDLRAVQPDGLQQVALSYCLQALQLFEGMDQQGSSP